ncbi:hypothetical protein [Candidatus Mesenet endosymbiont of Agriotes lineatus]|uniref:hypothetical protein n=1 Tax=Candidatus Mesenet endosymbiont of Agriotes lineatus TaxID=3077948 RepID=UPI0030CF7D5A
MNKKELEQLYYIFVDNTFASPSTNTNYCDQEELTTIILSFTNQDNNQLLPSSTITKEDGKSINFCYYAAAFIRSSLEQDNHNGLLYKNIIGQSRDGVIKYVKNYIHDEKYSQIFYEVLGKYLSDDYTFDTILKKYLDTKRSIESKAKENTTQRKPKTIYKQSISEVSYMTYSSFTVPHKSSIIYSHSQSTNTSSINTLSAIKTNYTVPLIISVIPLCILFYYIIKMTIRCYHYISTRSTRDCKMIDDDNKLPQSILLSSGYGLMSLESEKTCDENQL